MARIFKTPFGAQGDTEQVPEAPQGDGSVSLTQGFGYDYEREYEDPAAKDIRREVMNGLFHDITEAVGDIQLSGIAKWDAAAAPYPAGAVVWHDSVAWRSTSVNNNDEPGSGGWRPINAEATETEAGISAIATQAEVDAGEDDAKFVTAMKLQGKTATAAEAQALTSLSRLLTPGRLADAFGGSNVSQQTNGYQILPGGIIIQWGRGGSELSDKQPVSFNIAFPNNPFFVTVNDETADTSGQTSVGTMGVDPDFDANGFVVRHSDYGAPAIGAFSWFSIGH